MQAAASIGSGLYRGYKAVEPALAAYDTAARVYNYAKQDALATENWIAGKVKKGAKMVYGRRRLSRRRYRRGRGRYSSMGGKRARIGERIGTSTCKTNIAIDDRQLISQSSRILNGTNEELISTDKGDAINQRTRQVINLRGWKMDFEVVGTMTTPCYVNLALVMVKGGTTSSGVPNNADFFRYHSADRARNFGTFLSGLEFGTLPINTDKYVVLKHKRMLLIPGIDDPGTFRTEGGKNWRRLSWYIKVKRQIRYDASQNIPESGQVYLLHWGAGFGESEGAPSVVGAYSLHRRIVQYFRDPAP